MFKRGRRCDSGCVGSVVGRGSISLAPAERESYCEVSFKGGIFALVVVFAVLFVFAFKLRFVDDFRSYASCTVLEFFKQLFGCEQAIHGWTFDLLCHFGDEHSLMAFKFKSCATHERIGGCFGVTELVVFHQSSDEAVWVYQYR